MALNAEKERKVERWLMRKHVNVEEIAGFTFMQFYKPRPGKCKPYWRCLDGVGVFIFTLNSGFVRGAQLQSIWWNWGPRLNPAWVVQYLLERKVPFTNYNPPVKQLDKLAAVHTYNEFSKRMRSFCRWGIFWLVYGMLLFLGGWSMIVANIHASWLGGFLVLLMGILLVGLSLNILYMGIFCQYSLTLDLHEMVLQRQDKQDEPAKFAYSELRKVNFTSMPYGKSGDIFYMEFLDADFAYYSYPIERVPVKRFDEIVSQLRQLGIDATNSCQGF